MEIVRQFENRSIELRHNSMVKEAAKFGQELGFELTFVYPNPVCRNDVGEEIPDAKTKKKVKEAQQNQLKGEIVSQKWQGKLTALTWSDPVQSQGCFKWLSKWKTCPTQVVTGICEMYEQLLPTRVYYSKKTRTGKENDVMCRLCGKAQETVAHILTGCSALAQSKYLHRHNSVLKILFFEILHQLGLIDSVPPWYSQQKPKPVYEIEYAQAFWDVPLFAEHV